MEYRKGGSAAGPAGPAEAAGALPKGISMPQKRGRNGMYNNIGGKIKKLAVVICVLGMIASLIAAITIWAAGSSLSRSSSYYGYSSGYGYSFGGSTFLVGLLVLALGALGSWIGGFFMYGFGELIENSERTSAATEQLVRLLQDDGDSPRQNGKSSRTVNSKPNYLSHSTPPVSNITTGWMCAECGTLNSNETDYCKGCGAYKK